MVAGQALAALSVEHATNGEPQAMPPAQLSPVLALWRVLYLFQLSPAFRVGEHKPISSPSAAEDNGARSECTDDQLEDEQGLFFDPLQRPL